VSKNYELLRNAEKDLELFRTDLLKKAGEKDRPPVQFRGNGHPSRSDQVREEILQLVQRVFLTNAQFVPQMVVFSAVERGNGCSWICARAGEALAAIGEGKVCLVDANLHSPMLHRYFGVNGGSGLANAILEEGPVQNFVQPIHDSNLWLMSGKALPSNAASVMNRDRLKMRITELRSGFAFILVDAPPVSRSLDSLFFGQLSDGMVLVVEAHSTRRDTASRAKEKVEAANIKLLGAVLNKRTYPIPHALYRRI
jgi:polysaccharide biosynthesis transport protein